MPKGEGKLIAQNKKARHDYTILDTIEAGIVLQGTEIKAIRNSRINLKDGFVRIRNGEAFLVNVHISPYEQGIMIHYGQENCYCIKSRLLVWLAKQKIQA